MNDLELIVGLKTPHKAGHLVLAASHRKDFFDSHAVDCPFPFRHDDRYFMTFVGFDGIGYRTGLAGSSDLENWTKEGLIMDRGPKGSPTEFNVALTCILRDNELFGPGMLRQVRGRFLGTYHAYPKPGYEAGPASIGLCWSDDLRHWQVDPPILHADPRCEWEAGGLYKSWLLETDGVYYLFYNAKNHTTGPWIEQTGFASSTDLVHWTRHPGNPVLRIGAKGVFDDVFASDPCVFRYKNKWVMFYFGLCSDGHARDSVAFSDDLKAWRKSGEVLIDVGPAGSVDSAHAHKPGIIAKDGHMYHFYCAVSPAPDKHQGEIENGEIRGISYATTP